MNKNINIYLIKNKIISLSNTTKITHTITIKPKNKTFKYKYKKTLSKPFKLL